MSQYAVTMGATMQMIPIMGFMGFLFEGLVAMSQGDTHWGAYQTRHVAGEGAVTFRACEGGKCVVILAIYHDEAVRLSDLQDAVAIVFRRHTVEKLLIYLFVYLLADNGFKSAVIAPVFHCVSLHFALVFDWLISFLIVHTMRAEAPRV